jgi:AcrR family transcriptional regulator
MSTDEGHPGRRPRPGRPPRIGTAEIIAAARALDPRKLTMQAVAQELQVERSAVNYHVKDREQLLELVAADIFRSEVERFDLQGSTDWQQVLRDLGRALRNATIKSGVLHSYLRLPDAVGETVLRSIEKIVLILRSQGFAEEDIVRALTFVSQFAFASARDTLMVRTEQVHPQVHPQVRSIQELLASMDPAEAPTVRRLASSWDTDSEEQFDFNLDILVEGMKKRLESRRTE